MQRSLIERIASESGMMVRSIDDEALLAGMFNAYRPHGSGLDRLLLDAGAEGAVRARVLSVFEADTAGWRPDNLYVLVRKPRAISTTDAIATLSRHVQNMRRLALYSQDSALADALATVRVESGDAPATSAPNDLKTAIYECVSEALGEALVEECELLVLREALYSLACDYDLAAYVLWPALETLGAPKGVMDDWFDLWRSGVQWSSVGQDCLIVHSHATDR